MARQRKIIIEDDLGASNASLDHVGTRRTSVGSGSDADTCRYHCPDFEGVRNDPNFFEAHREQLKRCFDLGGAISQLLNGEEIIVCPVGEEAGI